MGVKVVKELPVIMLKPIGIVRNELKQPIPKHDWGKVVSEIVVDPNLTEALDNLDEFSHLVVLFWMQRRPSSPPPTKVHPMANREIPRKGVFATRSPNRPNPVGKTTVRLLQRRGNILRVEGLDAIDETPVIDIKPYVPGYDSAANARAPQWITKE
jgi:tRNA-Thr(GGU) m(6)t(6)A37 methyltransferase TsaA